MPLFRTNQFHDLFKCLSGIGHKNNVRPASIALLSYLLIRRHLLFPLHLCTSGTFILRIFSHFFYNINKIAFTVITVIKTLQYCWFARDVTSAMLGVKNKSISLLWEVNSIFM